MGRRLPARPRGGLLPIRQAIDDDEALAEERRLLYVGITRARTHLALSWADERETRGRRVRRQPSRFLLDLRPRPAPGTRIRELPGAAGRAFGAEADTRRRSGRPPVRRAPRLADGRGAGRGDAALRHRPRRDAGGDRRARPRSLAALRRVKGMGPTKLEKYGDEILDVLERVGRRRPPRGHRCRTWRCRRTSRRHRCGGAGLRYLRTTKASRPVLLGIVDRDDADRVGAPGAPRLGGDDPAQAGRVEPAGRTCRAGCVDVDLDLARGGRLRATYITLRPVNVSRAFLSLVVV